MKLTPWQQRALALACIVFAPLILAAWLALGFACWIIVVLVLLCGTAEITVGK